MHTDVEPDVALKIDSDPGYIESSTYVYVHSHYRCNHNHHSLLQTEAKKGTQMECVKT